MKKQIKIIFKKQKRSENKNEWAVIREFRKEDFWNGFLKSLDSLKQASNIDKNKAELIFEKINVNPDHVIAAIEIDENRCLHNTAYRIKIH